MCQVAGLEIAVIYDENDVKVASFPAVHVRDGPALLLSKYRGSPLDAPFPAGSVIGEERLMQFGRPLDVRPRCAPS